MSPRTARLQPLPQSSRIEGYSADGVVDHKGHSKQGSDSERRDSDPDQ